MFAKFGQPRASYTADCQAVINAKLKRNIGVAKVGPLTVQGLLPAIQSLTNVFQDIAREQPDVYNVIGTAGMLCCSPAARQSDGCIEPLLGNRHRVTIAGVLDVRGDGRVQYGLTLIAPIFNRHGWYWGAGAAE